MKWRKDAQRLIDDIMAEVFDNEHVLVAVPIFKITAPTILVLTNGQVINYNEYRVKKLAISQIKEAKESWGHLVVEPIKSDNIYWGPFLVSSKDYETGPRAAADFVTRLNDMIRAAAGRARLSVGWSSTIVHFSRRLLRR